MPSIETFSPLSVLMDPVAVQEHGAFTLVLSGGSLLKALGKLVGMEGVQYDKWHVFYVDERNVPHSSEDSTHKGAQEGFLGKVSLALMAVPLTKLGQGGFRAQGAAAGVACDKVMSPRLCV